MKKLFRQIYCAPQIEVELLRAECGFAASDFTTTIDELDEEEIG